MRRPKRVLIIDYNVVSAMLSGHSLLTLIDQLDPARYVVATVFNRPCAAEKAVAARGNTTFIVPHGGGSLAKRCWQYGTLPGKLWRIAQALQPDIIHANNVMAARPAMLLKALTATPVVVHVRNTGLLPRFRQMMFRADHFACVSQATKLGTLPPFLHPRTSVVYDGLDLAEYSPSQSGKKQSRLEHGLPQEALLVGMAGRISPQKGQIHFIEAARQLTRTRSNVVFVHAGGIPDPLSRDAYERTLAEQSRDLCAKQKMRWLGYLDPISQFWNMIDVVVVPSCGPEAFGRVLIEAMAMERPVVATRSGGPEEIIEANKTGLLVPLGDTAALTAAIDRLVAEPQARRLMATAARADVEQRFSAPAYANRITDMYDKVLIGAGK